MAPAKLTSTIGARLPPRLRERLNHIVSRHGTSDSAILEKLLTAFCDAVEEADAVRWPAVVILQEQLRAVAETQAPYEHGQPKVAGPPGKTGAAKRHPRVGPTDRVPKSA